MQFYALQAQFSQIRPVAMPPMGMGPRMPMYPAGAPGLGHQFIYGQAPPGIIPQVIILIFPCLNLVYLVFFKCV